MGVVHTNYISYAKMYQPGSAGAVRRINQGVCRAHCDRLIKLSDTLQVLPRSAVCNVHGVRSEFLEVGRRRPSFTHGAYFIGKVLWAKGYRYLIDYLSLQAASGEAPTRVDIYGPTVGDDYEQVAAAASEAQLKLTFKGGRDHADAALHGYKVFVNPSRTEVLSTTTAEALAMGKFVVIQRHPSNAFFERFPNALLFDTPEEFLQQLRHGLASTPAPLTDGERRALSWEGATDRFLAAVEEAAQQARPPPIWDRLIAGAFGAVTGTGYRSDFWRAVTGAGPVVRQRWLHAERRFRACNRAGGASVEAVVDKSVAVTPPPTEAQVQAIAERKVQARAA